MFGSDSFPPPFTPDYFIISSTVTPRAFPRFKATVIGSSIAPNLLERNFEADKPNQKWITDITEISLLDRNFIYPQFLICTVEILSAIWSETSLLRAGDGYA